MIVDFRLTILDWVTQRRFCNISFSRKERKDQIHKGRKFGDGFLGNFDLGETLCLGVFVAFL